MTDKKCDNLHDIVKDVCKTMRLNGYDPIKQLAGYLITDDPSYIPPYDNARLTLTQLDRDDMLYQIIKYYISDGKVK